MATLSPYRGVPPVRPIVSRIPHPATALGRPSVNLGHIMNSATQQAAHLFPHVGVSNPIPFNVIVPKPITTQTSYGSRVSTAIAALTRPVAAANHGSKPVVNFGHRVTQAIRSVTK